MLKKLELPVAEAIVEPLFRVLDKNHSGFIEYDEFKTFIFFDPFHIWLYSPPMIVLSIYYKTALQYNIKHYSCMRNLWTSSWCYLIWGLFDMGCHEQQGVWEGALEVFGCCFIFDESDGRSELDSLSHNIKYERHFSFISTIKISISYNQIQSQWTNSYNYVRPSRKNTGPNGNTSSHNTTTPKNSRTPTSLLSKHSITSMTTQSLPTLRI